MDWTTIVTAVVSAISGGGLLSVFYMQENRRKKQLENDAMASDAWQEMVESLQKEKEEMRRELRESQEDNKRLRDENNSLTSRNTALNLMRCERNGCDDRRPPRDWERKTATKDGESNEPDA